MSTGSSRFRIGQVSAPATPVQRIEAALDGPPRELLSLVEELAAPLCTAPDVAGLQELLSVVRSSPDPHRSYAVHKVVSQLVIAMATSERVTADLAWAAHYDAVPQLLLPILRERPAEPELLNLVGLAYYELGETAVARRMFEAIRSIEPQHLQARINLKACKERAQRGVGVRAVPEALRRGSAALQREVKDLAGSVTKLPRPTVSLCMIVKDEEEMLPACLEAAAPWVDEVIVVDTGSSDRTREIALEHGAKLHEFPWTGSFADARNESVRHATGDWILYLDADEHLVDDDGKHIRELARKTWVEGFYLVETHFTGDAEMGAQTDHTAMRLYQNRPEYVWKGIIHEQKLYAFPTYIGERFQNSPIRVLHYGYLQNVMADRDKRERNLQLLLQQADSDGGDAFNQFNIGSEYGAMHDWQKSLEHFERALELSRREPGWQETQFAPMMVNRLVQARRGVGDDAGAVELIDEGLSAWPDFTDLEFERAQLLGANGDIDGSRASLERCLAMGDAPARYVANQGRGSFQARIGLGQIAATDGDFETAERLLLEAFDEAPQYLPTILELADVMLRRHEPDYVAALLDERLGERAHGVTAALLLATSFYEHGDFDHADTYYARVLAANPRLVAALIGSAELRLAQHRFDQALEVAQAVPEEDMFASRGARTEFLAAVVAQRPDALRRPLDIITATDWLPQGERTFYTAWNARLTGGTALLPADNTAAALALQNLEALAKLEQPDAFELLAGLLDQALPDARERHLRLGGLYLRRQFADMAAQEFMQCAQEFGPEPQSLTGLAKVATMKELWEDAEVFLTESLKLDPKQQDAQRLLELIQDRRTG